MADRYYSNTDMGQRFQPGTTAESGQVDQKFDEVTSGFEEVERDVDRSIKLPDESTDQLLTGTALQRRNKVVGFDSEGRLALLDGFTWRGDWTPSTDYFVNDVVRDPDTKNLYVSPERMTSGLTFNAANWSLALNVVDVENAASAAEAARDTTLSARDTTIAARNVTLAARDTTNGYLNATLIARDTTLGYRNTAEEHKNSAANTWNLIRGAYYGALTSDPTLDPLGNVPNAGDRYYNTTIGAEKVFNGSVWRVNDLDTYKVDTDSGEQLIPAAINRRGIVFDSVADMQAFSGLKVGAKARTLGYYAAGDGGGNDYEIVAASTGTDDGGSFIDLSGSGLQAKGLFGATVNVKQFGAAGNGVNDDSIAIQRAINSGISPYFPDGNYVITQTVIITSNRVKLQGSAKSFINNMIVDGSACLWFRNESDVYQAGNNGPSGCSIDSLTIRRMIDGNGASVRLTRTTGFTFSNLSFWGGAPDVLQEGAQNTTYQNCSNSPTTDFVEMKTACIEITWHGYSDGSKIRGFTTNFLDCSFSSSLGDSYRYDTTVLIKASDVTRISHTYFGSGLTSLLIQPDDSDINISGIQLDKVHFDDGGSDVRYQNTPIVVDGRISSANIGVIQVTGSRFTNNLDNFQIFQGAGVINGAVFSGCVFLNAGRRNLNIIGSVGQRDISCLFSGCEFGGWGMYISGDCVYALNIDTLSFSNCKINGYGDFSQDFLRVLPGGANSVTISGGTTIKGVSSLIAGESNAELYIVSNDVHWDDGATPGVYGLGADVPLEITDFSAALLPGFYRYQESVAIDSPASETYRGFAVISRSDSQATSIIAIRGTASESNTRVWIGYKSTEFSSPTWEEIQTKGAPLPSYSIANLPAPNASNAGVIAFVADDPDGAVTAFSDGDNWRRTTDRGVII